MISAFLTIAQKLTNLALPPICPITGDIVDQQGHIHPEYWRAIRFMRPPICQTCGITIGDQLHTPDRSTDTPEHLICGHCLNHPPSYDTHRSAIIYNQASKPLILRFKHGDQHQLLTTFKPWITNLYNDHISHCDFICPVPLHYRRLLKRRYNQAALLAATLAQNADIPHHPALLKRHKHTASQGHKNAKDRYKNVRKAFSIPERHKNIVNGKRIVLIDDVYTTGATVNSCAKTLKAAGAVRVDVLTIARVIKD